MAVTLVGAFVLLEVVGCRVRSTRLPPKPERGTLSDGREAGFGETAVPETRAPELPADASLEQLRFAAFTRNRKLREIREAFEAQLERAPQARSLPEPRFTYSEFLRSVETRTGPQERSFGLQQAFPWFGKLRLRGSMEDKRASALWQRFIAAGLDVDFELRSAYADYYFLGRSIHVTEENLELLTRLESVAREKYAAGAENHPDVIRLQVEIGRLEDRLRSLRDSAAAHRARLNALVDRAPRAGLEFPSSLPAPTELSLYDPERVRASVEANHPKMRELRHEIERAQIARDLAKKEYFPDFSIGIHTIATDDARMAGVRGSGEDPAMVSLSIELPIWYSKYRAAEREAAAKARAVRARQISTSQSLQAEAELALFELRDAHRRFDLYDGTLVRKAEEALASIETSFQADRSDFSDLIDAERVLLEFQLAREKAARDRLRAEAQLDRLVRRSPGSPLYLEAE